MAKRSLSVQNKWPAVAMLALSYLVDKPIGNLYPGDVKRRTVLAPQCFFFFFHVHNAAMFASDHCHSIQGTMCLFMQNIFRNVRCGLGPFKLQVLHACNRASRVNDERAMNLRQPRQPVRYVIVNIAGDNSLKAYVAMKEKNHLIQMRKLPTSINSTPLVPLMRTEFTKSLKTEEIQQIVLLLS